MIKNINGNYKQKIYLYIDTTINKFPLLNNNPIYTSLYELSKQIISEKTDYYKSLYECLNKLFYDLKYDSYEYKRFNNISKQINLYDMFQDINKKVSYIISNKNKNIIYSNLDCKEHLFEFVKCYTDSRIIITSLSLILNK